MRSAGELDGVAHPVDEDEPDPRIRGRAGGHADEGGRREQHGRNHPPGGRHQCLPPPEAAARRSSRRAAGDDSDNLYNRPPRTAHVG
ncbi:hypothetical protein [Amycolatopsis sp. NPDC051128]|uniref:hypothetical protein n=1 Tax=Amycolatopsis sp. NPDC051128 TaxID=3155412 RepID=UPI0034139A1F